MTKPAKDRPLLKKRAERLDEHQRRVRTPLSLRVYLCPKCGGRMIVRKSLESLSVYYCRTPGCKESKKVARSSGPANDAEVARLRAENQQLKDQLAHQNGRLNGHAG